MPDTIEPARLRQPDIDILMIRLLSRPLPLLCLLMTFIGLIKLFLAWRLELYSDEIFYWQAAQFPALAYSDLPFMAALLAGTGAELFGHSSLAVRSIFLLMGSSLPLLIYWLARPLTGHSQAMASALLSFCVPMAAFLGLLAVPDVPLVFWGLLFIGMLERATRCGDWHWWLLAGLVAALGLSTHYRFSLYILAALGFMVCTRSQWHYWRTPRLWAAGIIAALGLYPAFSFNLVHDLSGIDYHLLSRHPWQFQWEGVAHPLIQSVIVTPLMYGLLWYTLWLLLQKAVRGDSRAGLIAAFALCNLGVYLLLAPWSDTTRTTLHWPLSGYLPLLVFAPATLLALKDRLQGHRADDGKKRDRKLSPNLLAAVPALGFVGTLVLFAGIGSQGFNQQLQTYLGTGVLSNKMAGWSPLTDHLQQHLQDLIQRGDLGQDAIIVSDNYYTSAQIAFAFENVRSYTIDEDKTVRDGRYAQYAIWGRGEDGVRNLDGENALFITEDSTLDINEKLLVMDRACSLFDELSLLDQLFLYRGDKVFSFYLGRSIRAAGEPAPQTASFCPRPSHVWLDQPQQNSTLSGEYSIRGWALNHGAGVSRIRILLNSELIGDTTRTVDRSDVVEIRGGEDDPGAPMLGFEYLLDTRRFDNGRYRLSLEVVSGAGERQLAADREIVIRNATP